MLKRSENFKNVASGSYLMRLRSADDAPLRFIRLIVPLEDATGVASDAAVPIRESPCEPGEEVLLDSSVFSALPSCSILETLNINPQRIILSSSLSCLGELIKRRGEGCQGQTMNDRSHVPWPYKKGCLT